MVGLGTELCPESVVLLMTQLSHGAGNFSRGFGAVSSGEALWAFKDAYFTSWCPWIWTHMTLLRIQQSTMAAQYLIWKPRVHGMLQLRTFTLSHNTARPAPKRICYCFEPFNGASLAVDSNVREQERHV